MTVNRRIRRTLVVSGVIASLLAGAISIRFAADMTAAAAPPPAPPVSLDSLKTALATEQARGAALQAQLDDLMTVTDQLTAALVSTEDEVKVDGLTAKELRARLKAADAKLKTVNRLLKEAQRRLIALGAAPVKTPKPATGSGSGSASGSGSGSGGGGTTATPTPAPPASTTFDLQVSVGSGTVHATWTVCSASGFDSYALVRSTDSEIHYPPEDGDTLVARIADQGTTSFDDGAPAGSNWYRLYCLTKSGGETRTAARSSTVRANVP
jgi:hypothetical protein